MEKGQHIGRLGVSIKDAGGDAELGSETTKRALKIAFKEFASYLMVGVLGGIGRAVSTWMVDHGARELIYMSRSAGLTTKDDAFIHELESMGCTVKLASGDTTKLKDVERTFSAVIPLFFDLSSSLLLHLPSPTPPPLLTCVAACLGFFTPSAPLSFLSPLPGPPYITGSGSCTILPPLACSAPTILPSDEVLLTNKNCLREAPQSHVGARSYEYDLKHFHPMTKIPQWRRCGKLQGAPAPEIVSNVPQQVPVKQALLHVQLNSGAIAVLGSSLSESQSWLLHLASMPLYSNSMHDDFFWEFPIYKGLQPPAASPVLSIDNSSANNLLTEIDPFRFYNPAEVKEKKERRRHTKHDTASVEPASVKLSLPTSQLLSGDTVFVISTMSDHSEYTLSPEPCDHHPGRLDPIAEISQVEGL
ncbi:hypothetical protein CIHG_09847 [Coccidioides immitis H538.4]|nr:hypothetical protein CIHG_09847 [Coccidioides immitis H538.4]